jgi:hypothetical protein
MINYINSVLSFLSLTTFSGVPDEYLEESNNENEDSYEIDENRKQYQCP